MLKVLVTSLSFVGVSGCYRRELLRPVRRRRSRAIRTPHHSCSLESAFASPIFSIQVLDSGKPTNSKSLTTNYSPMLVMRK